MLKKITTIISDNKVDLGKKVAVLGGVAFGMAVSAFMNSSNEPKVVVVEEVTEEESTSEPEATTEENNE